MIPAQRDTIFVTDLQKEKNRARAKKWYHDNREKIKARLAKWQRDNPEKVKASRLKRKEKILAGQRKCYYARREYYIAKSVAFLSTPKRRAWANQYHANLRKTNPHFRIYSNAIAALRHIVDGRLTGKLGSKWLSLLGCSPEEFRRHIESLFLPGMTWENHGATRGSWQIDHRRQGSTFDLTDPAQLAVFFHYTNTRPL